MKADIVICHPRDVVYPLWMYRMNRDRDLFGRIIVVMNKLVYPRDYTDYIEKTLKDATIIREHDERGDWRNQAINEGLKYVVSPYVLFLEQDFLVRDGFFKQLLEKIGNYQVAGFFRGFRLDPACLLVSKEVVDKTRKDFSAYPDIPPHDDHFCVFSKDVTSIGVWTTLKELGLTDYYHITGLTHNFRIDKNYHNERQFYTYLVCSDKLDQPEDWKKLCADKVKAMKKHDLDKEVSRFFE